MKVFDSKVELQHFLDSARLEGAQIGLVPTMGALHEGHARLVKEAVRTCDVVVCSIFVNPTQFNNPEDLQNYPKQIERDQKLLREIGCHAVFVPSVEEMYDSTEKSLTINFGQLESTMEGAFRPGHFSGVGIVVSKLFNIVQPHCAYFGQKDLQQVAIIKKLVRDLNVRTEIVSVPTVREENGLAMSSRNLRLSTEEKDLAVKLSEVMFKLKSQVLLGRSIPDAVEAAAGLIEREGSIILEYLEVVNSDTMEKIIDLSQAHNISVCIAAYVGDVRLIDNIYLKQEG